MVVNAYSSYGNGENGSASTQALQLPGTLSCTAHSFAPVSALDKKMELTREAQQIRDQSAGLSLADQGLSVTDFYDSVDFEHTVRFEFPMNDFVLKNPVINTTTYGPSQGEVTEIRLRDVRNIQVGTPLTIGANTVVVDEITVDAANKGAVSHAAAVQAQPAAAGQPAVEAKAEVQAESARSQGISGLVKFHKLAAGSSTASPQGITIGAGTRDPTVEDGGADEVVINNAEGFQLNGLRFESDSGANFATTTGGTPGGLKKIDGTLCDGQDVTTGTGAGTQMFTDFPSTASGQQNEVEICAGYISAVNESPGANRTSTTQELDPHYLNVKYRVMMFVRHEKDTTLATRISIDAIVNGIDGSTVDNAATFPIPAGVFTTAAGETNTATQMKARLQSNSSSVAFGPVETPTGWWLAAYMQSDAALKTKSAPFLKPTPTRKDGTSGDITSQSKRSVNVDISMVETEYQVELGKHPALTKDDILPNDLGGDGVKTVGEATLEKNGIESGLPAGVQNGYDGVKAVDSLVFTINPILPSKTSKFSRSIYNLKEQVTDGNATKTYDEWFNEYDPNTDPVFSPGDMIVGQTVHNYSLSLTEAPRIDTGSTNTLAAAQSVNVIAADTNGTAIPVRGAVVQCRTDKRQSPAFKTTSVIADNDAMTTAGATDLTAGNGYQ